MVTVFEANDVRGRQQPTVRSAASSFRAAGQRDRYCRGAASQSGSGAYSNTATMVTINGSTYAATYGKNAKGVSQFIALVCLDGAGCTRQWEFPLK